MELNFNWKYKDYELRACPKHLVRFSDDEENETIDLIKWQTDKEGFDLILVGTRVFDEIEEDDLEMVWDQLHTAQLVLDRFWDTEYKLNRKEWR